MTTILGIDPGSRTTGYGVIIQQANQLLYLDSGCIRTTEGKSLADRLHLIFTGLRQVIAEYSPDQVGIEQVFMARNADSALKLGQARGAAILACAENHLPVFEYSARQVKQAVVGTGAADKHQVQAMICRLLGLLRAPQADAADALGIAICHAHTQHSLVRLAGASKVRRGRIRKTS